eukprot:scaffold186501_cov17-Tisochrysis_lutea.AAC.1
MNIVMCVLDHEAGPAVHANVSTASRWMTSSKVMKQDSKSVWEWLINLLFRLEAGRPGSGCKLRGSGGRAH